MSRFNSIFGLPVFEDFQRQLSHCLFKFLGSKIHFWGVLNVLGVLPKTPQERFFSVWGVLPQSPQQHSVSGVWGVLCVLSQTPQTGVLSV